MADQIPNEFLEDLATAAFNGKTTHLILLMSNSTLFTENDGMVYLSDYTTLDECDSVSGYARKVMANKAIAKDDANDRAEVDWDDVSFTSILVSTRSIKGFALVDFVTDDTDSKVVAVYEFGSNVTLDGTTFTIQFDSEGVLQFKKAA